MDAKLFYDMHRERIIALISAIRDKANRFLLKRLDSHSIKDIAPAHGGIFVHLFRNTKLTMGEIVRLIDREKSTVTTLVDKLVRLGYLEREKDVADNSVTKVRLTKKGKKLEADFGDISKQLLDRAYAGFTEKEKDAIIRLLTRVNNNF
ncbi:MAG: MarR family transcriptional regulator [Deltaproteobacteria bacterium]|nr:MarR family transcriptional regulator [Deltaproteobacteria bacterium]